MKKYIISFLCCLIFISSFAYAENFTISTYYPSPLGNYGRIKLSPREKLNEPCDSGSIFVDLNGNLHFCRQDEEDAEGGKWITIGVWKKEDDSLVAAVDAEAIVVPHNKDGEPLGSDGMLYYNAQENKFRAHQDGFWRNVSTDIHVKRGDVETEDDEELYEIKFDRPFSGIPMIQIYQMPAKPQKKEIGLSDLGFSSIVSVSGEGFKVRHIKGAMSNIIIKWIAIGD